LYKRKQLSLDLYGIGYQGMTNEQLPVQESTSAFAKDENGLPFVPAYATLNFKAAWFLNPNLTINAGFENITNQLYRPYGSGISAAGQNLILGIRCRW
jgi:hemoglobin/transferrin/lactoferrin receptor protein